MTLQELVLAQALVLTGPLEEKQKALLGILCSAAITGLEGRLKDGLSVESCKADFIAAASLYALSALNEAGGREEFKAGDLTIKQGGGGDAASRCLRRQAELVIGPYLKSAFSFLGV